MRVLHVYKDYAPVVGGIENHVRVLAEAQAERGHDVTVLVTAPGRRGDDTMLEGVRVLRAGRLATLASTPLSPGLAVALRQLDPQVTHLHVPYPVGEAAWLLAGRRPMVATYHSDVVRQRLLGRLWSPGLRLMLSRADRVLATSPHYVESSPFLSRVRNRVTIVPLGIDPAAFTGVDASAARASFGGGPSVVFVGRLVYYKGLDVLLEALASLADVRLIVAGDGPMAGPWRQRAHELGVAPRVTWLGRVPDEERARVLAAGDLYVLPATARSEAFGVALLEAMAAGLPLVTTEVGTGTSYVNVHGKTGLVVPARDPRALAGAIDRLLGDDALRASMAQEARHRVAAEFTEARMIERVLEVYREVAA